MVCTMHLGHIKYPNKVKGRNLEGEDHMLSFICKYKALAIELRDAQQKKGCIIQSSPYCVVYTHYRPLTSLMMRER